MNIEELRKTRTMLEADLLSAISARVANFQQLTGLSPRSITVDMGHVYIMGSYEPETHVARVSVGIEL